MYDGLSNFNAGMWFKNQWVVFLISTELEVTNGS